MVRQLFGLGYMLVVTPDPERSAERLPELRKDLGQLGLDGKVVGAVREHDLVLSGLAHGLAEALDDRAHALLGVVMPGQAGEVVVVRKHLARNDLGRPRVPAEDDADVVDLVARPA